MKHDTEWDVKGAREENVPIPAATMIREKSHRRKDHRKMPSTPNFPRRSPIQVLAGLDLAWLRWADEKRYVQGDMAVGDDIAKI